MAAQQLDDAKRLARHVAQAVKGGVTLALLDVGEQVGRGLLAEAGQTGDAAIAAGRFQLGEAADLQLVIQGLDLLRAQTVDREQFEDARWEAGFQFVEVSEVPGLDQFGDLLGGGFADAFDLAKFTLGGGGFEVARVGFDGAGGGLVGAYLERIFPLEIEQLGDPFERMGDSFLGHGFLLSRGWETGKADCQRANGKRR